ncbi:MAG TPA: DUF202 domain-containing protein [Acidobacteriaceae bacterium]|jgi:putative membrane protein|nr:DUF202 domain-containing protein [Acidobacteriaceae bacterium]
MTESTSQDPRTYFAAEQVFLAWIRTGLALMGFGFVVARFGLFLRELQTVHASAQIPATPAPHSLQASLWFGVALVALGFFVNIFAAFHHVRLVRQLSTETYETGKPSTMGLTVAGILAVSGLAVAIYLIALRY